ncbi:hypothetical protein B0919_20130 [Hymenobacter sp. CRA2]|nr:hypothetical protein B0919_20130 [Hymenobacter sp. CRA2]
MSTQAQQPFERFGVQVKVLTLSNGRYPEFYPNDSLRRIGSVVYNTRLKRIAYLLPADSLADRAPSEVTSRWLAVDPLAHKYAFITPYAYGINNPIRYIDPDGREIVDAKGNHVQVTYNKNGTLSFSKNATADVRRIANALTRNPEGRSQLHKLDGSDIKVHLGISQEARVYTDKDGVHRVAAETVQGNYNKEDNYGKVQNADGTLGIKEASITVFEGTLKGNVRPNSGSEHEGLTLDEAIGAVVSHEIVHATDKKEINADLQSEQRGEERLTEQREQKPEQVERNAIEWSKILLP